METVNLGRAGLEVSRLCLGCMTHGKADRPPWTLDEAESRPFIEKAPDLGITSFDTGHVYSDGSIEENVDRALPDYVPRDEIVLATEVNSARTSTGEGCRAKRSWRRSTRA